MRRIVVLVVIVGGLLAWGSWTFDELRQGDAQVREANQERLTLVGELQTLERRLEDLDTLNVLADEATFYDKQWNATWEGKERPSDSQ